MDNCAYDAHMQMNGDGMIEEKLAKFCSWARKSNQSMSWNKSGFRDTLSALIMKTMDTIFRLLGYGYIAAMLTSDVQFEQDDELQEACCKF